MTKPLVARSTLVGKIRRRSVIVASVGQQGRAGQIGSHGILLIGELENGVAGIVLAFAAGAIATLHMLNRVGARSETNIPTNGARHVPGTVDLHVHVQFILIVEGAIALAAPISIGDAIDAILATRITIAFSPLVATEASIAAPITTIGAVATHLENRMMIKRVLVESKPSTEISRLEKVGVAFVFEEKL
eukprot:CAMPEP_0168731222 /NCGR_PEP_ID=MMETSP0724-20121128/7139_1 /TAXON_ID=265536 /ORGANISM="Amphiprora sp., Strain CCMP467" /LENGTH=189 /DNA_ID=CAMNT_0008778193 /DNA_START=214 /DNA_END=783 /DNA_ORIENTATION=+